MTVPGIVSSFVEPVLGILADTWRRRVILLSGGVVFAVSTLLTAASPGPGLLLFSWILFSPASGAFVSIAQVSLMDYDPARREQGMARWSFAGSIGMAAGPLALGAAAAIGLGWRGLYLAMGGLTTILVALSWVSPIPEAAARSRAGGGWAGFRDGLLGALRALRSAAVLRWLLLLEVADLMGDILFGFVALYFVDVAGLPVGQAAGAVVLWTVSGLLGDFLLIPLLERVNGLSYLRTSAAMAVSNVAGLAGSLIPLGLGLIAETLGLRSAMWLLLAAPAALLSGLPRGTRRGKRPGRPRRAGPAGTNRRRLPIPQ